MIRVYILLVAIASSLLFLTNPGKTFYKQLTNLVHSFEQRVFAQTPAFTFTAVGDYGQTINTGNLLTSIASSSASFNLALGDLSYGTPGTENSWCDFVKSKVGAIFPFELLAGNHEDDNGANGHIDNFAACLPDRIGTITGSYGKEYYFDYQNLVRIIMISPALTLNTQAYQYTVGSSHYTWLSDTIDGARAANIPWVIVGMHENCISMGEMGCTIGTDLLNLLVSKKVDLVLQGHDHNYQRSKQLALGPSCTSVVINQVNTACIVNDGSTNSYRKGDGTVFMIVGVGGDDIRDVFLNDSETGYFAKYMGLSFSPRFGYGKFDVASDKLAASFVGTSNTSNFTDSFAIDVNAVPPSPAPTPSPSPVQTSFLLDSFTDTAGTLLQNHRGDSDSTWTKYSFASAGSGVISGANRARPAANTRTVYYSSAVPPTGEYDLLADLTVVSNTGYAGLVGRLDTATDSYYYVIYNKGTSRWELTKRVNGTNTVLGYFPEALTVGGEYKVKFQIRDAAKTLFVQNPGANDYIQRISSTDNTLIAAGRVGLTFNPNVAASDTVGLHFDNYTALNPSGSTPPPATFDFSIANQGPVSVVAGNSVTNNITGTLISGTTQGISFSVSGLPTGATSSFSQTSCSPTCSTTLTIFTSTSTPAGVFPITVTAVGGGLTKTTSFDLTVTAPPPPTPPPGPSFITDSYTDAPGTLLQNHSGEAGLSWVKYSFNSSSSDKITDANRLRSDVNFKSLYYNSIAPLGVNYDVSADLYVASKVGYAGLVGRLDTATDTYYFVIYNSSTGKWELYKRVSGTNTVLATFAESLTPGATYSLIFQVRSTGKTLLVKGPLDADYVKKVSSADDSISSAGLTGVIFNPSTTPSNTVSLHLDNFSAVNQ